ncbi:hypothetical protein ACFLUA_00035 [Chloroflexota bacterium]
MRSEMYRVELACCPCLGQALPVKGCLIEPQPVADFDRYLEPERTG